MCVQRRAVSSIQSDSKYANDVIFELHLVVFGVRRYRIRKFHGLRGRCPSSRSQDNSDYHTADSKLRAYLSFGGVVELTTLLFSDSAEIRNA